MKDGKAGSRVRGNDDGVDGDAPPGVVEFVATLIATGSVRDAVAQAEIDFDATWALREAEPAFEHVWDRALRVHRRVTAASGAVEAGEDWAGTVH